jgi:hypothetical protein
LFGVLEVEVEYGVHDKVSLSSNAITPFTVIVS